MGYSKQNFLLELIEVDEIAAYKKLKNILNF